MIIIMITIATLLTFMIGAFSKQFIGYGYGLGRSGIGIAAASVFAFSLLTLAHLNWTAAW